MKNYNLNIPIVTLLDKPKKEWELLTRGRVRIACERKIDVDWNTYTKEKYLYSHCSIVCSVNVEENGYYIVPPCDELVNANANAWATQILLATFRTFIGKPNFLEHLQILSLSKGVLLDAVARPVIYTGKNGKTAEIIYIDLLVATDRRHTDLVDRIERNEVNAMSMGAVCHYVTCSKCGKIISDSDKNCIHLDNELLTYFTDENRVERIVAELCGRFIKVNGVLVPDEKSNEFIEASWVEKPAFKGAVLNHFIHEIDKKVANIIQLKDHQLQAAIDDIFKIRVADREGMLILKTACAEIKRMRKLDLIDRVANVCFPKK